MTRFAESGPLFNQNTKQLKQATPTRCSTTPRQIERRRRLLIRAHSVTLSGIVGLDPEGRASDFCEPPLRAQHCDGRKTTILARPSLWARVWPAVMKP